MPDGSWRPLPEWDGALVMSLFRDRLLARLVESHAISQELVAKLLAWRHPGFSAHVGEPIAPEEKQRLEETAAYLVRNPLSLKKLVYLDGRQAVLYRSRRNPFLGRNFEAMDPLEWLARFNDHIPETAAPHALLRRLREPGSRLARGAGSRGGHRGRGGRASPALFAELGADDRQGLPSRPNSKDREGNDVKSEGTVKGADITWTTKRTTQMGEMVIVYKGKIDGKTMAGTVEFGAMGSGEWKAERVEQ